MTVYNINPGYLKENQTYQLTSLNPTTSSSLPSITISEQSVIANHGQLSKRQLKKLVYGTNGINPNPKPKCAPSQPTPFTPMEARNFSVELAFARPFLTRCANIMNKTVVEADVKIDKKRKLVIFFSDIPATIIGADRTVAGHKIPESLKTTPSYRCFISRMIAGGVLPETIWMKCIAKQNVDHCLDIIMPTMYHIIRKLDNIMQRPENLSACGVNPMYLTEQEWLSPKGLHLTQIKNEWFSYGQGIWQKELPNIMAQLEEVPQGEDHIPYVVKDETEVEWLRINSTIQGRLNDPSRPKSFVTDEDFLNEMTLYEKTKRYKATIAKPAPKPVLPKEKDMPHLMDRLCPSSNPIRAAPIPLPSPPSVLPPVEENETFCRAGPVYYPKPAPLSRTEPIYPPIPPTESIYPPQKVFRLNLADQHSPTAYYYQEPSRYDPSQNVSYFQSQLSGYNERKRLYPAEYPPDYGDYRPPYHREHYESYSSTSAHPRPYYPPSYGNLASECTCLRAYGIQRLASVKFCRSCRINQPCPIVKFDEDLEDVEVTKLSKPNPIETVNNSATSQKACPIIDLTPPEESSAPQPSVPNAAPINPIQDVRRLQKNLLTKSLAK